MSTRLDVDTFSTREVTVDIEARHLRAAAAGHDTIIVRVIGLVASGGSGRPVTRSIRIPVQMLEDAPSDW